MNFNYKTIPACNPQNLAIAQAGGPVCLADVVPAPGSTTNDPSIRSDATAFGEDTQRGYDQLAFFGSVDFDIIPHVLTISGGTRWYQYKEFLVGSQYSTGTECLNVPNGQCAGGVVNIDAAHDRVTYAGFKSRANITWHVNQDVMTYFTFSQGFRPGGFNRSVSGVATGANGAPQFEKPNGYAPDSLDQLRVGHQERVVRPSPAGQPDRLPHGVGRRSASVLQPDGARQHHLRRSTARTIRSTAARSSSTCGSPTT